MRYIILFLVIAPSLVHGLPGISIHKKCYLFKEKHWYKIGTAWFTPVKQYYFDVLSPSNIQDHLLPYALVLKCPANCKNVYIPVNITFCCQCHIHPIQLQTVHPYILKPNDVKDISRDIIVILGNTTTEFIASQQTSSDVQTVELSDEVRSGINHTG